MKEGQERSGMAPAVPKEHHGITNAAGKSRVQSPKQWGSRPAAAGTEMDRRA